MNHHDDLLHLFKNTDRQNLFHAAKTILTYLNNADISSSHAMNTVVVNLLKHINFNSVIDSLPIPEKYHRISLCPEEETLDVVLFVFKSPTGSDQVALLHTYDNRQPNKCIYSTEDVINPILPKKGSIVTQTPPHSHKASCHSCVAWIKNKCSITEQFYQLKENNRLFLCKNEERSLYDCGFENSLGKIVHSISITFNLNSAVESPTKPDCTDL